jgi:hypothetical protein
MTFKMNIILLGGDALAQRWNDWVYASRVRVNGPKVGGTNVCEDMN